MVGGDPWAGSFSFCSLRLVWSRFDLFPSWWQVGCETRVIVSYVYMHLMQAIKPATSMSLGRHQKARR